MPKRTHVAREKAIRMLQAYVTLSVIAQKFRCHARMIERLRKRFWHNWNIVRPCAFMASSPNDAESRPIKKRRYKLLNQFRPVTMIASTTAGTHNSSISAQTVTNRLREIGERLPHTMCVYMRRFFSFLV